MAQPLVLKFKKSFKLLFFYFLLVPLWHLFIVLQFTTEWYLSYFFFLFLSAFLLYKKSLFLSNLFLSFALFFYMIIFYYHVELSDYLYNILLDFDLEYLNYHIEPTIITFLTLIHLFILFLLGYNRAN